MLVRRKISVPVEKFKAIFAFESFERLPRNAQTDVLPRVDQTIHRQSRFIISLADAIFSMTYWEST